MAYDKDQDGPLERYLRLLELIAAFPDRLALADVATLSDLPKTTAHRLLKGLVKADLAIGGQGGRAYSIGPRLSRILHATADTGWLETIARPILSNLAEVSGEACYLTKLVDSRVFVAASEAPEVRWRSYVQPGHEMPPHAAASAKAIIAYQPEDLVARALSADLPKLTANTCNDPEWIHEEYARVRERGHATCIGEVDEGLAAIAAPVLQRDGLVLYAVGMSGPLQRLMGNNLEQNISALSECAALLARKLSFGAKLASA
ncbi:helix-turn-helix domain-containing protein [Bosea sp. F3-2]|uniref:IclR family transcriptional regulator n=1 Tax=Bosea sp. F3-2 TaxID=2599640 RepID=UPI0011EEAEA8|nr:IclR family transcriptional regulator C-terminal domain-containing protein [Bosea sp. F3-2]QEL22849.1 helix-turn-helix domain-containing protein [Bosea sp. F3-2]